MLVLLMDKTLWSLMAEEKDIMCNIFAGPHIITFSSILGSRSWKPSPYLWCASDVASPTLADFAVWCPTPLNICSTIQLIIIGLFFFFFPQPCQCWNPVRPEASITPSVYSHNLTPTLSHWQLIYRVWPLHHSKTSHPHTHTHQNNKKKKLLI